MDDAYKSLVEALLSAGWWIGKKVEIVWIDARKIGEENVKGENRDDSRGGSMSVGVRRQIGRAHV